MTVIILTLLLAGALIALHFITDWFFVPSLDSIATRFKMSSDVAGATLMAAGSSAPELFVAVISIVFIKGNHEAIGIGTIVGSSLFNALVIVGFSLYLGKKVIKVWQPILRDLIFYLISGVVLIVSFWDGYISFIEGTLLLFIYMVYLIALKKWKKWFPYTDDESKKELINQDPTAKKKMSLGKKMSPLIDKINQSKYLAFLISIVFITILSWALVHLAIELSVQLGVHEVFVALTIIAIGTSVPDLMSSMIVAKQGRPGMAINNAIGSNVFDILIGLGLPLMILSVITGFPDIKVDNKELFHSFIVLLISIVILFTVVLTNRYLNRKMTGVLLALLYAGYLGYQFWLAV